jgi:hypothetical protein
MDTTDPEMSTPVIDPEEETVVPATMMDFCPHAEKGARSNAMNNESALSFLMEDLCWSRTSIIMMVTVYSFLFIPLQSYKIFLK